MRFWLCTAFLAALIFLAGGQSAQAALKPGDTAPLFSLQASLGGTVYSFSLADALKKGPVVLYFYPAAFTSGCTLEAHKFADAMDQFHALGATVIGVSHDPIEKLDKFSVSECRGKFPVAADTEGDVMKAYDTVWVNSALGVASRVSYVISPEGKVIYAYESMAPDDHVANCLRALTQWRARRPNQTP